MAREYNIKNRPAITIVPRHRLRVGTWSTLVCAAWLVSDIVRAEPPSAISQLAEYHSELDAMRKEFGGIYSLPDVSFFLFGMGARPKLVYKCGSLIDSSSGKVVRQWTVKSETIIPPDYRVALTTTDNASVNIIEDEQGIWIEEKGRRQRWEHSETPVRLPAFAGSRYPLVLRVLHQELLINVAGGKPLPNYLAYPKAWLRDGAMTAMCLKTTGNLNLIKDWVLGLSEPYDRNNHGESEADNLGQTLYLISLVSDRNHPLVPRILQELPRWEIQGPGGKYLQGQTDFSPHPVYQTKWAKFGLASLGLSDLYVVPSLPDSYSALFWMAYKDTYVKGHDANDHGPWPYLGWACDHFHGTKTSPISNRDYPLTWEQGGSQAHFEAMNVVSEEFAKHRWVAPHSWHAAEIFLLLIEPSGGSPRLSNLHRINLSMAPR
jgi:hypothetical protein